MTPLLTKARQLPGPVKVAGGAIGVLVVLLFVAPVALTQCSGDPDDPMPIASATVQEIANGYCAEDCERWAIYDPDTGYWYNFSATIDQAQALDGDGFEVRALPTEPPLVEQNTSTEDGSRSVSEVVPWWWWLVLGLAFVLACVGFGGRAGPGQ